MQATVQTVHGLASCAEWTGVQLGLLLEETGIDPRGKWILAESADVARMSRSIPLLKAKDDAIVALYQNGERRDAGQRLSDAPGLAGWIGNMNVKCLRSIKVTERPTDDLLRIVALFRDATERQGIAVLSREGG